MRFPPLEEVDATADDAGSAAPPRSGAPATSATAAPSRRGARGSALRTLGRRAVTVANALDKHEWARWVRRIIVLPIGERFALISLVAAFATPRATFVALLAWGGFAALYTGLGRILRSMAR
jgi:hypothetical protein